MARKTGPQADANPGPEITQAEPTGEPERDAFGFVLDSWGLPIVGPERARRLALLGREDPNVDPEGWPDGLNAESPVEGADTNPETSNG